MREGCEYCGRSAYMNDGPTCDGCGAPVKPVGIYGDGSGTLAYIYDPRVFDEEVPFLGRPGVNIPINLQQLPKNNKSSGFYTALTAGATKVAYDYFNGR
jgi:hypothetical protein